MKRISIFFDEPTRELLEIIARREKKTFSCVVRAGLWALSKEISGFELALKHPGRKKQLDALLKGNKRGKNITGSPPKPKENRC